MTEILRGSYRVLKVALIEGEPEVYIGVVLRVPGRPLMASWADCGAMLREANRGMRANLRLKVRARRMESSLVRHFKDLAGDIRVIETKRSVLVTGVDMEDMLTTIHLQVVERPWAVIYKSAVIIRAPA